LIRVCRTDLPDRFWSLSITHAIEVVSLCNMADACTPNGMNGERVVYNPFQLHMCAWSRILDDFYLAGVSDVPFGLSGPVESPCNRSSFSLLYGWWLHIEWNEWGKRSV
jgi:hypothetical protein